MINITATKEDIEVKGNLINFQDYFVVKTGLFIQLRNLLFNHKNIKKISINNKSIYANVSHKTFNKGYDLYIYINQNGAGQVVRYEGSERDVPEYNKLYDEIFKLWKSIRYVEY